MLRKTTDTCLIEDLVRTFRSRNEKFIVYFQLALIPVSGGVTVVMREFRNRIELNVYCDCYFVDSDLIWVVIDTAKSFNVKRHVDM